MAQKDIQEIANFMKEVDDSIAEQEKAYEEAHRECEEQEAFEGAGLEDEVIDKASLGFIDDSTLQDESDDFYTEDEESTLKEDVSDCIEQEAIDEEPMAFIEVEVYNEDGFGEHFAKEVSRNVPRAKAAVKKALPNGDLLVKMSGARDDLENAFAFYVGKEDFSQLSQDDKEEFESRLVFEDGDTLAEADYREAVAHCLDPIGVHASTADLADQDTCAISIIKEEKAKRFAKKALKCLKENDFSSLSDEDLDKLDVLKDKIDNGGSGLSGEDDRVWQLMLKDMGITQKQWEDMTPEQREKFWDASPSNQPLRAPGAKYSSFGDAVHTEVDPKTGKKFKYRNQYDVSNPETGGHDIVMFNPNYDADSSTYQHPSMVKRQAKKDAEAQKQFDAEKKALDAMKAARGKDTWDVYDFSQMIAGLDDKQRKAFMNELIADVEKDHGDDTRKAGEEIMFIKKLFGKKLTLRDFAKAWGKSAPGVMKFADETLAIWRRACQAMGIKSIGQFKNMPDAKFQQFLDVLKAKMQGRYKGSIVSGK